MAKRVKHELLVVDGYNVIYATPRYKSLMDEGKNTQLNPSRATQFEFSDPFDRARELLVADVAAFAQGRYDPVIVFDAAGNINPEHPTLKRAGVRLVFSPTGVSADAIIEKYVVECRQNGRDVTVVTSDNTIRSTVGGIPVKRLSSGMLIHEIEVQDSERVQEAEQRSHTHFTLADRLDAETLAKLNKKLGL